MRTMSGRLLDSAGIGDDNAGPALKTAVQNAGSFKAVFRSY
jgi:hypothetical protein